MLTLILCSGTWPGPSIITWHAPGPGHLGEFAQGLEFGELRGVVASAIDPGRSPSPSEKDTS